MSAELVKLEFTKPCDDVCAMLRKLADDISEGTYGEIVAVTTVAYRGHGDCSVFGFGSGLTAERSYLMLDQGKEKLRQIIKGNEE